MKARGYEHGIITHKDKNRSHSIKEAVETQQDRDLEEPRGERRSTRLSQKQRIDYKKMDKGKELPKSATSSEVTEHMADGEHDKTDMKLEILGFEDNWWKRGVQEAIDIKRHKPTLNKDLGRYHLAPIWDELIRKKNSKLIGRNSSRNGRDATKNFTTEEDQP